MAPPPLGFAQPVKFACFVLCCDVLFDKADKFVKIVLPGGTKF